MLTHLPYDRQLARRLARAARTSAKAQLRAEIAYFAAVSRRERALARARRGLPRHTLLAAGSALATAPLDGGWAWCAGTVTAAAGLAAWGSLQTLRHPPALPQAVLPGPRALPPPPPRGSAAFPAVRRLEFVRAELHRLVPLVAPTGRGVAEQAWRAAAEADGALRWQAARLAAAEPYCGLDVAVLRTLDDGVAFQEQLVAGMADLVAACADPLATARVQDATDALYGLAQGLREVRAVRPPGGPA